ncbi:glucose 1-dehydrogenase [bacterium AH-315-P15]|nr:glucose 1-dehydrogenase [bacterium AH-315-P15]
MPIETDFDTDLSGLTALVTGTTSGLGKRFAQVLAAKGAKVALTGRRVERLENLKNEIEADGGTAAAIPLDVTNEQSIINCVAETEKQLGAINILVNNAGMNVEGFAVDVPTAEFDRLMSTNVRAVFLMAREVARGMIERGKGGQIINIASIAAKKVWPGLVPYCTSKAAVAMMTQSLAQEWARFGINVNAICPGYIETEINEGWFDTEPGKKQLRSYPRRRAGVESDLDGALLLLASPKSRFITGELLIVDDGQSL